MEDFLDTYRRLLAQYSGYGNIICQNNRDQGDSCQREGTCVALLVLDGHNYEGNERLKHSLSQLRVAPGVYRRSPNLHYWGSNPNNLSRDQRAMLELAMALCEDKKNLKEAGLYLLKRGGFHQNTHPGTDAPDDAWKIPDIVSPGELAVFIRGLDAWWLYPLLYVLDLGLLVDISTRKKRLWDADNMLAVNIIYANKKYPTLVAKLAKKLYNWQSAMEQIKAYYTNDDNNGIPPLGKMYLHVIKKFIGM